MGEKEWKKEWKCWLKTPHLKNKNGIQSHHFMANRWENNGNSERLFSWAPKSLQMVTATMKLKVTCSLGEKLWPTSSSRVKSSHSVVSSSLRPQWTVAHQAPPSMGFSRQEYWSRLPVTNVDNILKSRDVTLPIKVYLVKTMVFPVVMYGCES